MMWRAISGGPYLTTAAHAPAADPAAASSLAFLLPINEFAARLIRATCHHPRGRIAVYGQHVQPPPLHQSGPVPEPGARLDPGAETCAETCGACTSWDVM